MDKTLADYAPFEKDATIPIMMFSPTIIDDGRRLLLSSTPMSYLTESPQRKDSTNEMKIDGIGLHSFSVSKMVRTSLYDSRADEFYFSLCDAKHLPAHQTGSAGYGCRFT